MLNSRTLGYGDTARSLLLQQVMTEYYEFV